jgi:hypothetical protein
MEVHWLISPITESQTLSVDEGGTDFEGEESTTSPNALVCLAP